MNKKNICFIGFNEILGMIGQAVSLATDISQSVDAERKAKQNELNEAIGLGNDAIAQTKAQGVQNFNINNENDIWNAINSNPYAKQKNALSQLSFNGNYGHSSDVFNDKLKEANFINDTLSDMNDNSRINAINNYNTRMNRSLGTVYALGGQLSTNGMTIDNGLTKLNGYKHGEGAYSGIPIGMGSNGELNVAEDGETIKDDYVFSDSFIVGSEAVEKYGFPKKFKNKTIAECSKIANKEVDERGPADTPSKNTAEALLKKLRAYNDEKLAEKQLLKQLEELKNNRMDLMQEEAARQEIIAQEQATQQQSQQIPQQPQMFKGGGDKWKNLAKAYGLEDMYLNDPSLSRKDYKKYVKNAQKYDIKYNKPEEKPKDQGRLTTGAYEKAAVALNSIFGTLGPVLGATLTKKPDYSSAEAIKNSITKPKPITAKEVKFSIPEAYKPRYTNIDYFTNQAGNAFASQLAGARANANNAAQYNLMASNAAQQYYNSIGDLMRKGYERNDAEDRYKHESELKRNEIMNQQELANVNAYNKASELNAGLEQAFNKQNLAANKYYADVINDLDTGYSEALSGNISDIFTNTAGAFGTLWGAKAAETENYAGVAGKVKPGKFGGNINRRKRRRYGK